MITDEQANELNEAVVLLCKGATPTEKAMVGVMTAILSELRSTRKATTDLLEIVDNSTAGGAFVVREGFHD